MAIDKDYSYEHLVKNPDIFSHLIMPGSPIELFGYHEVLDLFNYEGAGLYLANFLFDRYANLEVFCNNSSFNGIMDFTKLPNLTENDIDLGKAEGYTLYKKVDGDNSGYLAIPLDYFKLNSQIRDFRARRINNVDGIAFSFYPFPNSNEKLSIVIPYTVVDNQNIRFITGVAKFWIILGETTATAINDPIEIINAWKPKPETNISLPTSVTPLAPTAPTIDTNTVITNQSYDTTRQQPIIIPSTTLQFLIDEYNRAIKDNDYAKATDLAQENNLTFLDLFVINYEDAKFDEVGNSLVTSAFTPEQGILDWDKLFNSDLYFDTKSKVIENPDYYLFTNKNMTGLGFLVGPVITGKDKDQKEWHILGSFPSDGEIYFGNREQLNSHIAFLKDSLNKAKQIQPVTTPVAPTNVTPTTLPSSNWDQFLQNLQAIKAPEVPIPTPTLPTNIETTNLLPYAPSITYDEWLNKQPVLKIEKIDYQWKKFTPAIMAGIILLLIFFVFRITRD